MRKHLDPLRSHFELTGLTVLQFWQLSLELPLLVLLYW